MLPLTVLRLSLKSLAIRLWETPEQRSLENSNVHFPLLLPKTRGEAGGGKSAPAKQARETGNLLESCALK